MQGYPLTASRLSVLATILFLSLTFLSHTAQASAPSATNDSALQQLSEPSEPCYSVCLQFASTEHLPRCRQICSVETAQAGGNANHQETATATPRTRSDSLANPDIHINEPQLIIPIPVNYWLHPLPIADVPFMQFNLTVHALKFLLGMDTGSVQEKSELEKVSSGAHVSLPVELVPSQGDNDTNNSAQVQVTHTKPVQANRVPSFSSDNKEKKLKENIDPVSIQTVSPAKRLQGHFSASFQLLLSVWGSLCAALWLLKREGLAQNQNQQQVQKNQKDESMSEFTLYAASGEHGYFDDDKSRNSVRKHERCEYSV